MATIYNLKRQIKDQTNMKISYAKKYNSVLKKEPANTSPLIQMIIQLQYQKEINLQYSTIMGDQKIIYKIVSIQVSKKTNFILSGGMDNMIRLWEQQQDQNQWKEKIFKNTRSPISCMILNKQENSIIVGNKYGYLQIFYLNIENSMITFTNEIQHIHTKEICGISLNPSQNRIITCSLDKKIVLWRTNEKGYLENIEESKRDNAITGIFFLNDNKILLAENKKGLIQLKLANDIFQKNEQIIIQDENEDNYYFPIQYNQIRKILLIKSNRCIYILKELNNDVYEEKRKLELRSIKIYGTLSTNSKHLVIYNEEQIYSYVLFE
ncbi:unnamed protein product (macronuclear) [Paramecium tetraurelia]|uniref:Uncharacterized protein n=1 Tax=Paramecium tetraurelia TaxID=5888 RepID=A0EIJ4_PARTE|nr:uncharacterized protein GSPATT00027464001 [Paramecium tetraurelia]CAK95135.1 unnamed protein product [Paramecium tetraurelia]|eukprot:XP_001462508.1 hypothetical protein (macronuclear) [Paramecium tetraurelia strain d4-2]